MSYIELAEIDALTGLNKTMFVGDCKRLWALGTGLDTVTTNPFYCIYTGISVFSAFQIFSVHYESGVYPFNGTVGGVPNIATDRIYLKNGVIIYRGAEVTNVDSELTTHIYGWVNLSLTGSTQKNYQFIVNLTVKDSRVAKFIINREVRTITSTVSDALNSMNMITVQKRKDKNIGYDRMDLEVGRPYYYHTYPYDYDYDEQFFIYQIGSNWMQELHFKDGNDTIEHLTEIFPGTVDEEDGGFGNFDDENEEVDFQDLPTISANDCGFITMFKPSTSQLMALSSYLWTSSFYDTIKKIFGDPMDALLGLSIIPLNPSTSTNRELKVGFVGTGITMPVIDEQYMSVDCGSLTVSEYWGSALDYAPYTKLQLFLPYIGTKVLSTDDVMNKVIEVKYNIDILSGSLIAQVKCDGNVLYEFNGTCLSDLPISGRDFTQIIGNAIGTIGSVGVAIASGGATAVASGLAMANNVMNSKPDIQHSGNISSTCGLLSHQKPYLIIERPRQSLAENYKHFVGYPSNLTRKLSTLSGYTEIDNVFLDNLKATDDEKDEIYKLLLGGVIL